MIRALATAWLAGSVFGVGLLVSGMSDPANIRAFLDFTGSFRPELALVMASALLVYAVAIRLPRERRTWRFARASSRRGVELDGALFGGAAVFGIGWGLGGYCPGPSIVAAAAGRLDAIVFVGFTLLGIIGADAVGARGRFGPGEVAECSADAPAAFVPPPSSTAPERETTS
jgi:uncharacterized membrane protein YedE/YeeE